MYKNIFFNRSYNIFLKIFLQLWRPNCSSDSSTSTFSTDIFLDDDDDNNDDTRKWGCHSSIPTNTTTTNATTAIGDASEFIPECVFISCRSTPTTATATAIAWRTLTWRNTRRTTFPTSGGAVSNTTNVGKVC